jgi:2-methylisocitrate lyase-like PEP mutase family enzyme
MTQTLRQRLSFDSILVAPGAYDGFTAKLIEKSGFEAVYLSGAGISYSTYGQPDLGLMTQSEMVQKVGAVAQATTLPVIADGDTGYGNAINTMQTVRLFEQAGARAIQLEDQQFPKRCGHLSGKELIPAEEMVGKIRAACDARATQDFVIIARTDARSVLGLDEALRRGQLYVEAGADVLFIESPYSKDELHRIAHTFPNIPLMANMIEGGKTPLVTAGELQALGFALVIFPNSLTRHFAYTGLQFLKSLKVQGTTQPQLEAMMSHSDLNQLLGIEQFRELEERYLPDKKGD